LAPLTMYLSPLRSAVVRRPATSDPASERKTTVSIGLQRKRSQHRQLTIRLRHSQAKSNASIQDSRQEALLLLLIAEVDERWGSDAVSTGQPPDDAQVSATSDFIENDQIVEAIPLIRSYVCRETNAVQIVGWHRVDCGSHVALTAMLSEDLSPGWFVRSAALTIRLQGNTPLQVQNLAVPIARKMVKCACRRIASPPSAGEHETLCSKARLCGYATAAPRMEHC
jgi:hypothetical protein